MSRTPVCVPYLFYTRLARMSRVAFARRGQAGHVVPTGQTLWAAPARAAGSAMIDARRDENGKRLGHARAGDATQPESPQRLSQAWQGNVSSDRWPPQRSDSVSFRRDFRRAGVAPGTRVRDSYAPSEWDTCSISCPRSIMGLICGTAGDALAPCTVLFAITLGNDDFVDKFTARVSIAIDHGGIELPEALHPPEAECRNRI